MNYGILPILILFLIVGGCRDVDRQDRSSGEVNRNAVSRSPDGAYAADIKTVPLNRDGFTRFWCMEIKNREGRTLSRNSG